MHSPSSYWFYLSMAILFGAFGTICLKLSKGLKKLWPTLFLAVAYSISFAALTICLQGLEISVVYAVWSGFGTLLVTIVGIFLFHESVSFKKIMSIVLIILGVLGIHLANVFH